MSCQVINCGQASRHFVFRTWLVATSTWGGGIIGSWAGKIYRSCCCFCCGTQYVTWLPIYHFFCVSKKTNKLVSERQCHLILDTVSCSGNASLKFACNAQWLNNSENLIIIIILIQYLCLNLVSSGPFKSYFSKSANTVLASLHFPHIKTLLHLWCMRFTSTWLSRWYFPGRHDRIVPHSSLFLSKLINLVSWQRSRWSPALSLIPWRAWATVLPGQITSGKILPHWAAKWNYVSKPQGVLLHLSDGSLGFLMMGCDCGFWGVSGMGAISLRYSAEAWWREE